MPVTLPHDVRAGHVDRILTNLSVAYLQSAERFVADKVFPVVPVARASDTYFTYPRGYFLRDEVGPRPLGGYPRQVGYAVETDTYFVEEEALEFMVDDRVRANSEAQNDPETQGVRLLMSQMLIHREQRWADTYFKTGVWGTDLVGTTDFVKWNDASSDPISDLDVQRESIGQTTGFDANVLVLGRRAFRHLKNHPDILDRIKYTQRGLVTQDLLATMLGVDRILVPGGIKNTAAEGDTDNFDWIVSDDDALLVHAAPSPGLMTPSGGYIFAWTGLLGGNAFSNISVVTRGRDTRAYSDWFHVRMAYDMQIVSDELGIFFSDAVD